MTVRCDLHAIDRELKVEVRVCDTKTPRQLFSPFIVVELRVGNGWVTLFLSPGQALDLARSINRFVQPLDEHGEPVDDEIMDKGGAL